MRTISTFLVILMFFLGYLAMERQVKQRIDPIRFLPEDTIIYLEQNNGLKKLQNFNNSPLGQAISGIDYGKVAQELEIETQFSSQLTTFSKAVRNLLANSLFQKVLGKYCMLAVFSDRSWSVNLDGTEYFKKQTLLICRPSNIGRLRSTFLARTGFREVGSARYGQYKLHRFVREEETVVAAVVGEHLLVAMEERVLREALANFDNEQETLYNNPAFRDIHGRIVTATTKCFFDLDALRKMAGKLAHKTLPLPLKALQKELDTLQGFPSAGYGGWFQDSIHRSFMMVGMDRQKVPDLTVKMLAAPPEGNDTIPFVVDDVLLYYWSNTVNLRLLWEMYISETVKSAEEPRRFSDDVKEVSGYSVEELTEMMDGNVGIILRPSDRSQFVPIPDTAIAIKLRDRKGMKAAIDTIAEYFDLSLQDRKYKNVTYYYWGLYPFENLQPVYTIHNGYLIFANTKAMFTTIIDQIADKDPLVSAIDFSAIDPGFLEPNNSVCYIHQEAFMQHLREFISWGGTLLAIQDRRAAAKSKILIDELIDPLLLGLTMYEKVATRTWIEDEWVVSDIRVSVAEP